LIICFESSTHVLCAEAGSIRVQRENSEALSLGQWRMGRGAPAHEERERLSDGNPAGFREILGNIKDIIIHIQRRPHLDSMMTLNQFDVSQLAAAAHTPPGS